MEVKQPVRSARTTSRKDTAVIPALCASMNSGPPVERTGKKGEPKDVDRSAWTMRNAENSKSARCVVARRKEKKEPIGHDKRSAGAVNVTAYP
jgi:hypothetical protein